MSGQRKVMDTNKLRLQVLPLFLVFTLLTEEIHGFTLPHASKENKESLTEAMVIHFVTSVYDQCRHVKTLTDSVCFLFSVGNSVVPHHLRKSIKVKFRNSKQLDFSSLFCVEFISKVRGSARKYGCCNQLIKTLLWPGLPHEIRLHGPECRRCQEILVTGLDLRTG